jgi:hypothetical protein
MTAAATVPKPHRIPVWQTVKACYAMVAGNVGQLARISWLWLMIMAPVYAAVHWLTNLSPALSWQMSLLLAGLPGVAELPFLASIAVAWHRLVLRQERITSPAYLRLDRAVWRYALYSLAFFLALTVGAVLSVLMAFRLPFVGSYLVLLSIIVAPVLLVGLVLPRLSLVLPAVALGEPLSPWQAWRITRGNTLRLALATFLCMLPALFVIMLLPMLSFLLWNPSWEDVQQTQEWTRAHVPNLIDRILDSISYAVFSSVAYALLTIFAVTLLSLAYPFLAAGREGAAPSA